MTRVLHYIKKYSIYKECENAAKLHATRKTCLVLTSDKSLSSVHAMFKFDETFNKLLRITDTIKKDLYWKEIGYK